MSTTNEDLVSWLNEMPVWVRDAAKTYYEQGTFSNDDVKRFAKECIDEFDKKKIRIDISSLNFLSRDERANFSITAIKNIVAVNALATDKSLDFNPKGITVVYGENGAGKSGYIRILKKLADAKYKEPLKRNVYIPSKEKQSCIVSVVQDGMKTDLSCDLSLDGEYPLLKDIDIFDTKISKAYVENEKEASYEPWIFTMLTSIADVSADVKAFLENSKNNLHNPIISIPEELNESESCKAVSNLTAQSQFDESFFVWSDEQQRSLEELEAKTNIDMVEALLSNVTKEIVQLEALHGYIERFYEFFSDDNLGSIAETQRKIKQAKEELDAAKLLFEENASDIDKKSISNTAWFNLWHAAKEYYLSILMQENITKYTEIGGTCPLCGQSITDEKMLCRICSVDELLNGSISSRLEGDEASLKTLFNNYPVTWNKEQLETAIKLSGVGDNAAFLIDRINQLALLRDEIITKPVENVVIHKIAIDEIALLIDSLIESKRAMKDEYNGLLNDDDNRNLISQIVELRGKRFVVSKKDDILSNVLYLQELDKIEQAKKYTASNKISIMSTQLAKEMLTNEYENRFNNELKQLTQNSVKVVIKQQKAKRGKIPFKVELIETEEKNTSVEEILSEGENRVVSLAAFFAEASGRNTNCPLIVDDPISSLDYKYEESVMRRLVEASKSRQVIVFTHRLTMVVGLHDICEKEGVLFTETEIVGNRTKKGIPLEMPKHPPRIAEKLKNLKNYEIAKLKMLDDSSTEYVTILHYVCQQVRNCVEKSVEDVLIHGIVKRYRHSIQTLNKLNWLSEITKEDCKLVDDMMTKYSKYDHSMSEESPLVEFELNEVEEDINALIEWLDEIKKRKKNGGFT